MVMKLAGSSGMVGRSIETQYKGGQRSIWDWDRDIDLSLKDQLWMLYNSTHLVRISIS